VAQTNKRPTDGSRLGADDLAADYQRTFGRPPEVAWSAPGRVNLIGEYMDLNESFVLPIAIPRRTRAMAAPRQDRALVMRSVQQDGGGSPALVVVPLDDPVVPSGWTAYPAAVALALAASGRPVPGADMLIDSDVPVGAGLSSSAALECAVAGALCTLAGLDLPPMDLALLARRAENDFVGVPCGIMDQAASMCCQDAHALLLDTRSLDVQQVPLDLGAAGLGLLVVDTRVKHELGDSAYSRRWEACQLAARTLGVRALRDVPAHQVQSSLSSLGGVWDGEVLKRARHVLTEQARVLHVVEVLRAGDPAAMGPDLFAGHASLRDDFEVSCAELDAVVEAAGAAGALGARMTGAGFGGSAIVLGEQGRLGAIESAVRGSFCDFGFAPPHCFPVSASAGARRTF
jgi:galactokinase